MGSFLPDGWRDKVHDSWVGLADQPTFRVLFSLVLDATETPYRISSSWEGIIDGPVGGVVTTLERLGARATGLSRKQVRRALSILARPAPGKAPAIRVVPTFRGLLIVLTLEDLRVEEERTNQLLLWAEEDRQNGIVRIECDGPPVASLPVTMPAVAPTENAHQNTERVPSDTNPWHPFTPRAPVPIDETVGPEHALSDLRSDQRSDPSSNSVLDHILGRPKEARPQGTPSPKKPLVDLINRHKEAKRIWAGADYIREQILKVDPGNIVSRQSWGPDVETGWRVTWANEIRLMVTQDGRSIDDIGRTLQWVFNGQGGTAPKYRLLVESASSLREKWDRIQAARRRLVESAGYVAPAPASHKRIV